MIPPVFCKGSVFLLFFLFPPVLYVFSTLLLSYHLSVLFVIFSMAVYVLSYVCVAV